MGIFGFAPAAAALALIVEMQIDHGWRILDLVRNPPQRDALVFCEDKQFAGRVKDLLAQAVFLSCSALFCARGGTHPKYLTLLSLRAPLTRQAASLKFGIGALHLALHGDGLQFEVPAAQQRARPDEFSWREILGREIAFVDGVEFV